MKSIHSEPDGQKFYKLRNLLLAEYNILYYVSEAFSISKLAKVSTMYQLLFIRFENQIQLCNLVMLDGIFPNIMADLAVEVLLRRALSFKEYILKDRSIIDKEYISHPDYLTYKFKQFSNYLLFSEIALKKLYLGTYSSHRVFCTKERNEEIKFYSILQQRELEEMMLDMVKLKINKRKSSLNGRYVKLCLQIYIE